MARAAGIFAFYRAAFLSGQPARRQNLYQHKRLDGFFELAAIQGRLPGPLPGAWPHRAAWLRGLIGLIN